MVNSEQKVKELIAKFEACGINHMAATECVLVAAIYEAFFEITVHETDAAATLTQTVIHSLIANIK